MTTLEPPPTTEDLDRLQPVVYADRVWPLLTPADDGKFVALDVLSGEFEIDADEYRAVSALRARCPGGAVYIQRVEWPDGDGL